MSRIEFDGLGVRIPTIALPPFGSDSDLPSTVLTFTDNAVFSISDYISLGFTHFEAWCVGGAGGRGSDVSNSVGYVYDEVRRPVPQDVWNLRLELLRTQDFIVTGVWDKLYSYGPGMMTAWQAEEYFNPTHLQTFKMYRQTVLIPQIEAMGGAGGGGGFQKIAGVLVDLPDSVPIVVGKAGADSPYAHTHQYGAWAPDMDLPILPSPDPSGYPPRTRLNDLYNYFSVYLNTYPPPHSTFDMPVKGADGGYSTFGDVGKASGGEGGAPGKIWNGSAFVVNGEGGDGGIGGRTAAGGGGAGSVAEGVNGSDGVWHPDTGIGSGGGGGKGGLPPTTSGDPRFGVPIVTQHLATAGGQGSYSFADTSVYGQRQFRQPWTYMKPVIVFGAGTLTYIPVTDSNNLVIPGVGGGARPTKNLKVGSRATGYSPDGVVVLRLSQIV